MYAIMDFREHKKRKAMEYFDRPKKAGFKVEKFKYVCSFYQYIIDNSIETLNKLAKGL